MTEPELSELEEYCRWRHEVEPEIPLRLITEVRRLRTALAYYAEHAHWQDGPNGSNGPGQVFSPGDRSESGLPGYACAEQALQGEAADTAADKGTTI